MTMSRPKARRLFDPDRKIYAQRSLRVSGKQFLRGDAVPWKKLKVALPMVQSWFRMRLVSHFKGGDQSAAAKIFYREMQASVPEPIPTEEGSQKQD